MKLPTFEESSEKVFAKTSNILEEFIYNWEPDMPDSALEFREDLAKLINWSSEELITTMINE